MTTVGRDSAGRRLGPYELVGRLGEGGVGTVYLALDVRDRSTVVVKVLREVHARAIRRFEREAAVLRKLRHPRVVAYLDHGVDESGLPYLVMEHLVGCDASELLTRTPLTIVDALRVASGVAAGLAAAHARGVAHRDMKPANIFLRDESPAQACVIDFGMAVLDGDATRLTATGVGVGTPLYMAPEQLQGEYDERTDVYGLGVTLYELIAATPPFRARNDAHLLFQILEETPEPLHLVRPDVPRPLSALVSRMLAKDPSHRPSDFRSVEAELADVAATALEGPPPMPAMTLRERNANPSESGDARVSAVTPLFGRARAAGLLGGTLRQTFDDEKPGVILIHGPQGMGKTALLASLDDDPPVRVLRGSGERGRVAGPFAVLRELLLKEPDEAAQRMVASIDHLGESGTDPRLTADRLRRGFARCLETWSGRPPWIVVDDAHWADFVSLRYLATACEVMSDSPLGVVLAGRKLDAAHTLFESFEPVTLELDPLSPRAALKLARRCLPDAPAARLTELVEASHGNPGQLRDLAARGPNGPASRESVWSSLGAEERRFLRAASVFGHSAPTAGVAELMGLPPDDLTIRQLVRRLAARGLVRRLDGRAPIDDLELDASVSTLAREAVHREDLAAAHAVAARWLDANGASRTPRIAEHWRAAGESGRAAAAFLASARAAFVGRDIGATLAQIDAGLKLQPAPELQGRLHALAAEAELWREEASAAADHGKLACQLLDVGSALWFRAMGLTITATGQLGLNDEVRRLAERACDVPLAGEGAENARFVCAARAATQLQVALEQLPPSIERIWLGEVPEGPEARTWAHRARGGDRIRTDLGAAIGGFIDAHEAALELDDPRGATQLELYLASCYVWSGAFALASEVIANATRTAADLGSSYLSIWADYVRGKLFVETRPYEEASALLLSVVARTEASPRIRAGAGIYAALAALRAEDAAAARELALAAREGHRSADSSMAAYACEVRAAIALEEPARAARAAAALKALLAEHGEPLEFPAAVSLALVEHALATDRLALARERLGDALARLRARAETLEGTRANELLQRPHLHHRLHQLAVAHGV